MTRELDEAIEELERTAEEAAMASHQDPRMSEEAKCQLRWAARRMRSIAKQLREATCP